jgi:hypothetical protein
LHLAQSSRKLGSLVLKATGTDGATSTASSSSSSTDEKIKTTMADLDALLGIQEEPEVDTTKVSLFKLFFGYERGMACMEGVHAGPCVMHTMSPLCMTCLANLPLCWCQQAASGWVCGLRSALLLIE